MQKKLIKAKLSHLWYCVKISLLAFSVMCLLLFAVFEISLISKFILSYLNYKQILAGTILFMVFLSIVVMILVRKEENRYK